MKQQSAAGARKAISAKSIVIPSVIAIVLMHVLLIIYTVRINAVGQQISEATQSTFTIYSVSNLISAGTDAQTELARSYAITGDTALISQYYDRSDEVLKAGERLAELLNQNGSEQAGELLQDAMAVVEKRMEIEQTAMKLRALSLDASLFANPQLEAVPLTEEQQHMPAEAQMGSAIEMVSAREYQSSRAGVQKSLGKAVGLAADKTDEYIRQQNAVVGRFRIMQYVLMAVVIATLVLMCVILFFKLLYPLEKCVEIVQRGDKLPDDRGFSELRRLADSYDELLVHRNRLEEDLRRQSVTDALTGLPNRLAFLNEQKQLEQNVDYRTLTVFSLDVNGLKEVNDKSGHGYGDELLCVAADCIREVFVDRAGGKCFRFGGDEFAALWKDRPESDITEMLEVFRRLQQQRGVTVSVGWAHGYSGAGIPVKELFARADKAMYREKARLHALQADEARSGAEQPRTDEV